MVHVVVQPVRVQKLGVRAPSGVRRLRGVVVREVVARQRHVEALRDVALVLGHERFGVVFRVAEHEEVAAVGALRDVDAGLARHGDELEVGMRLDIGRMHLGVARVRRFERVVEPAHER